MSAGSRNSSIELLRLVLMFMVVILHFNNGTMGGAFCLVKDRALDNFALHFFESLSVCAVNCFMIVSGYFLYANKTVDFGKVVDILLIVVFYRLFDYGCRCWFFNEPFSFNSLVMRFLPANYFAIFYVICYMLSPYVARLWNEMENNAADFLIGILLTLFILVPSVLDVVVDLHILKNADSLSTITIMGNGGGYTIIQFLVMLSLGMWLKKCQLNPPSWILICIYLFSSLIMTFSIDRMPSLYNYCSVFSVITAVCIFLLFAKFDFQSRGINYCAKSCFAIFCIHTGAFANGLWRQIITEEHFSNGLFSTLLWLFVCVGSMFICCMVLSIVMRLVFGKLKSYFCGLFPQYVNNWK